MHTSYLLLGRRMAVFLWIASALAALSAALPTGAAAQPEDSLRTIRGYAYDAEGAPLPGVNVYVPAAGRGASASADGAFRVADLPPAAYEVVFSYVGFAKETRTVDLRAGDATLTVTLTAATLAPGEIVVTAERDEALTPGGLSAATLDAEELDAVRGQTLGATLAKLPGVTTLSTGPSIAKPVVRGLHSSRVLVLNDGVRQEGQQWGGEHAPEIDPFAAGRIEVIKGAAGVEYGAGAIGGVIRVEPLPLPEAPGVGGRLSTNAFSNSLQGAASLVVEGAPAAVEGLAWRVQGSARRAGSARTPDYVLGNTAFAERSGALTLGYDRGRLSAEAQISRFRTELGIFRGAHIGNLNDLRDAIARERPLGDAPFSYEIDAPKQRITHDVLSVRAGYALPAGDRLRVQYAVQRNHRQEFDAHRAYNDSLAALDRPAFELTLITNTLEATFAHRPLGRWIGKVGVSAMNQGNVNGRSGYLIPNFRALTGGAFARETWRGGPWTLDAGLRFDYRWMRAFPYDRSAREFERAVHRYEGVSAALGGVYEFAPAWSVAVNAGRAWRPPGVNELYSQGVHHGTARVENGSPGLGPERSLDLGATLRHDGERASLEMSAFRNRISGFVMLLPEAEPTVTIRGVFPTFGYAQADAVLRGLDGAAEVQALPFLRLGASASVVRGVNLETDEPVFGMPSDRLRVHSRLMLPEGRAAGLVQRAYLDLETTFVREQTRVPEGVEDYAPPPPGYALAGLQVGADFRIGAQTMTVSLGVENLFNVRYRDYLSRFRYFADEPGRNAVLRISIPFGDDRS